jgi:RecA/RadA recombinase
MKRMISDLSHFLRDLVVPPSLSASVEEAAERAAASSREVGRQADEFSRMVRGMRGESLARAKRAKRK